MNRQVPLPAEVIRFLSASIEFAHTPESFIRACTCVKTPPQLTAGSSLKELPRPFTRILDLLASDSPDSDTELLEAVRKARRDVLRSEGAVAMPARALAGAGLIVALQ